MKKFLKELHARLGDYELWAVRRTKPDDNNCTEAVNARAVQEDIERLIKTI